MKTKLLYLALVLFCFETTNLISQNFVWAKKISGANNESSNSITSDASGNVYTTGFYTGTTDFDPGTGVFNLISVGIYDIFISKLDAAGNFVWAKSIGGTGVVIGLSITLDASGNVYTTGYFDGTIDFDPGAGVFNLTSVGGDDIFISKLDASGNFVWAKKLGGAFGDRGNSIAIDASGNVYTTGYFFNTVDFDPGAGVFNLTSGGSWDTFISKLDAAGNFVWAKAFGSTGQDISNSIALDASGNVFTTGLFVGTVDFDPSAGVYSLTSAGIWDIFISKLDPSGNFVWAKVMGGGSQDECRSIALDASGNLYTTGFFEGIADFDPGAGVFNLTSVGSWDIFISKLDPAGNFVWAKAMGGGSDDRGHSIEVDAFGNVYTTGYFALVVDFDPGAGVFNLTSAGNSDIFISKLDAGGNFVWAKAIGATNYDASQSMALDASGNVYTTGFFQNTVDFDPGPGVFNLSSGGSSDIFVHKMCQLPLMPSFISGTAIVCSGIANTYSIANVTWATSYIWSLPTGWNGASTTNTIIATPGTSGIFSLTASNTCGISSTQTLSVTVNTIPIVNATTSNSIICGPPFQGTATLTGGGAITYTWNPGGTGTTIAVSPSVTSTYTVIGTNSNGCINTSVITQSVSICSGLNQISDSASELKIYPNPNNGEFTINFSSLSKNAFIEIYNGLGQLVIRKEINNLSTKIDLTDKSNGLYILKLTENEKTLHSQKLIKN